ncbi:MAG: adenylyl-sulfate kinase [Polyangiaceae bacterium]|nr:adenylyl-sulfate kinase [Polyangiaceae bacterium]
MTTHSRATNITWDHGQLTRADRWQSLGLVGATLWFTGLSGSGKSTVAAAVEAALIQRRILSYRLDGDNMRHGLNSNLGFSAEDREENVRRVGEVAKLFADAGLVVLASFISPYRADREKCRRIHDEASLRFFEIYVDASIATCESRDPKGLYRRARAGEIPFFTGVTDPYEAPEKPDLHVIGEQPLGESLRQVLELLEGQGILPKQS